MLTKLLISLSLLGSTNISPPTDERVVEMTDFSSNKFTLYEGYNYYFIYDVKDNFLEGSYERPSPYVNFESNLIYLGPGNYFIRESEDRVYDIRKQTAFSYSDFKGVYYKVPQQEEYSRSFAVNNKKAKDLRFKRTKQRYTYHNRFTTIQNYQYFRNLELFPFNSRGTCGLVGISMLLGYYDTFYNDDFIPNDYKFFDGSYNYNNPSQKNEKYLIEKTSTNYVSGSWNYYTNWDKMPGTSNSLQQLLFEQYTHYIGKLNNGYPMNDTHLRDTVSKYITYQANRLAPYINYITGPHNFWTVNQLKDEIRKDNPALLVMGKFNRLEKGRDAWHIGLAYGFDDVGWGHHDFLMHLGWSPNTKSSAEVIIGRSTIFSHFVLSYNGPHKCSSNVIMKSPNNSNNLKGNCGCGNVFELRDY